MSIWENKFKRATDYIGGQNSQCKMIPLSTRKQKQPAIEHEQE